MDSHPRVKKGRPQRRLCKKRPARYFLPRHCPENHFFTRAGFTFCPDTVNLYSIRAAIPDTASFRDEHTTHARCGLPLQRRAGNRLQDEATDRGCSITTENDVTQTTSRVTGALRYVVQTLADFGRSGRPCTGLGSDRLRMSARPPQRRPWRSALSPSGCLGARGSGATAGAIAASQKLAETAHLPITGYCCPTDGGAHPAGRGDSSTPSPVENIGLVLRLFPEAFVSAVRLHASLPRQP